MVGMSDTESMRIPEAAVEAAAKASAGVFGEAPNKRDFEHIRLVLEAAAPHLLSHEREQTRLAHVDAVVNAETVDKLQAKLDRAHAALFDVLYKWRNGKHVYYSDLEGIRAAISAQQ